MNDFSRTYSGAQSMDMSRDAGLRKFMLGVYNKMGLGLLISAALAYAVGTVAPLTAPRSRRPSPRAMPSRRHTARAAH